MNKQEQGMENRLLGRWGESIVAEDLRKKGWILLGDRFRTRFGEIDLVFEHKGFLVFVEVKVRKNADFGTAAEFVDARKQHRIRAVAQQYMARFGYDDLQPRFDVAEVYAPQGYHTAKPEIRYIEDAF